MSRDVYDMSEPVEEKGIHIEYKRAILTKKIFAHIIDLFLFAMIGVALFVGARGIVNSTQMYKEREARVQEVMEGSGLYIKDNNQLKDSVSYYQTMDTSSKTRMNHFEEIIETFLDFVEEKNGIEDRNYVQNDYDKFRLQLTYNDIKMFVLDDGQIVRNKEVKTADTYATYNNQCYVPFIDSKLHGYVLTLFPQYFEDNQFMSNLTLYLELPIAVLLSSLLIYFIPPLIFRRGRQTLGMLIYHIGKADKNLLHIKMGKYLARSAIWIFGILVLAFLSFGLTLIVSATMMIFTKNKQDFPDYMLQIYDLDISDSKIYYSLNEIQSEYDATRQVSQTFKNDNKTY